MFMCLDRVIPPDSMWPSSGGGQKRKCDSWLEDEGRQTYYAQRQTVLNMSMIKLRAAPTRREQPLRRSVLIFNTLKHIETELQVEGVRWNLPSKPCCSLLEPDTLEPLPGTDADHKGAPPPRPPPAWSPMDTAPSLVDSAPSSSSSSSLLDTAPSLVESASDSSSKDSSPATVVTTTTDSVFSDSRLAADGLFNLTATSTNQQGPLPTFSSLLDLDCSSSSSSSLPAALTSPHLGSSAPHLPVSMTTTLSQHSTCRMSLTPPPTPTPDVFSDFDFPALDLDFFSYLPTSLKLPSLSAEDLQSLPHPEGTGNPAGKHPAATPAFCNPKHAELRADDLDSIMQILVGM